MTNATRQTIFLMSDDELEQAMGIYAETASSKFFELKKALVDEYIDRVQEKQNSPFAQFDALVESAPYLQEA